MKHVIVVDDEKIIRQWFHLVIQNAQMGFKVVGEASNGEEALQICQRQKVDIVITDIKMPKMDGIAFIKEVRKKFKQTKIIILSNHEDFNYAKDALRYD